MIHKPRKPARLGTTMFLPVAFGILLWIVGCSKPNPPVPPPSPEGGGGGIEDGGTVLEDDAALDGTHLDACDKACANLRTLKCPTGFSVSGEEACATSCRHAQTTRLMPLDVTCAERAKSLSEAHSCAGWGC